VAVPLVNTDLSIVFNVLIMGVLWGYRLLPDINTAVSSGIVFGVNILLNIRHFIEPFAGLLNDIAPKSVIFAKILKIAKIGILPLALFFLFLLLFQNANPIFQEKTLFLQSTLEEFLNNFATFSRPRAIFTLFGYIFLLGVFFKRDFTFFKKYLTDQQIHIATPKETTRSDMFQIACLSLVVLNALLLSVNFIDIQYLWFNFAESTAPEMSKLVHSGTYLLIVSVLISIIVLVFFFNNELNFHKKHKLLVSMALVWIVQNAILIGSVFIRNYKYVEMYGLTHKRIGVLVFLIISTLGLISIAVKILKKLNLNFMFITNSWSLMALFLALSYIDFDQVIAENNLKRSNCDLEYVKSLSIRAIPTIIKYRPELRKEDLNSYKGYIKESKNYTWLSWNLPYQKLENLK
jgi:hypothetical protein